MHRNVFYVYMHQLTLCSNHSDKVGCHVLFSSRNSILCVLHRVLVPCFPYRQDHVCSILSAKFSMSTREKSFCQTSFHLKIDGAEKRTETRQR